MDALTAFFALGTIWYFIVSGLSVCILFYCVEREFSFRSGALIIAYFIFLQYICGADIINKILTHPFKILIAISGYILIGFIWSTVKWWLYVNKKARDYKISRYDFLEEKRKEDKTGEYNLKVLDLTTEVPEELLGDWKKRIGHFYTIPKVHENKNKISIWVIYWPVSFIWSLLNDLIKKVIDTIIIKVTFIYNNITSRAFKSVGEFK